MTLPRTLFTIGNALSLIQLFTDKSPNTYILEYEKDGAVIAVVSPDDEFICYL